MKTKGLYLFFLLLLYGPGLAQKKAAPDTVLLSISFKGETLKSCIHKIETTYHVFFTYNANDLEAIKHPVTGSFNNKPLSAVLIYLLKNTHLEYRCIGGYIVIFQKKKTATISGFIKDALSGEVLIGASVFVKDPFAGASANAYGFYSLSLPQNRYELYVSVLTGEKKIATFDLRADTVLNITVPAQVTLEEVEIQTGESGADAVDEATRTEKLDMSRVSKMPVPFGEPDVMRALQTLPGIQTPGEVAPGYSVRGGSLSQNLVLLDDAPVYNPTHLMGAVSAFNTDMIKSAGFYKSSMPAAYQAGSSSVLDVRAKDGNNQAFHAGGGIGLLSARLYLEGPLKKDGGSFFLAGRKSVLSDFVLKSGFYDLNFKVSDNFGARDRIYVSAYHGKDYFKRDTSVTQWENTTFSLRHNHIYSGKMFSNTSLVYSKFRVGNGIVSDDGSRRASSSQFVENYIAKFVMSYFPQPAIALNAGVYANNQVYSPFVLFQKWNGKDSTIDYTLKRKAFEASAFADMKWTVRHTLLVQAGVRLPWFRDNTNGKVFYFSEKTMNMDSMEIKPVTFNAVEPRLSLQWFLGSRHSIRLGYDHINQFQQQFQGGSLFSIAQVWLPSSSVLQPQVINQYSAGYFVKSKKIMYSLEGYYKHIDHVSDFRDGAQLYGNDYFTNTSLINIESLLEVGTATSYGAELGMNKTEGRLTGWVNYTLSKTMYTIKTLNKGKAYPSSLDNRHVLSLGGVFQLNKKWDLCAAFNFKSGRAFSFPDSYYSLNGSYYALVTERNKERTPAYHRLDLSAIYQPESGSRKIISTWVFSIINVYNQFNPAYYSIDGKDITGHALFPVMPSVSYNFKF